MNPTDHPEDRVQPDPTNARQLSSDGNTSQPVNGKDFCLLSQAQLLVQLMRYEGAIPMNLEVAILDEPSSVSASRIEYGDDGRKVWVIRWQEPNPANGQTPYQFEENAGQLLFELKNFPVGFGDWRKNMDAGDIERIGPIGPISTPVGHPGKTVITGVSHGI